MIKKFLNKNKTPEVDDYNDDVEIKDDGPKVSVPKGSKAVMMIVGAIFSTLVIYFVIFKEDNSKQKLADTKLEEVPTPQKPVAGESPFAIEEKKDPILPKEDVDLVEKPLLPEAPTLPELPADAIPKEALNIATPDKIESLPNLNPNKIDNLNNKNDTKEKEVEPKNKSEEEKLVEKYKNLDPKYSPILIFSTGGGSPTTGVGLERNIITKKDKNQIGNLEKSGVPVKATIVSDRGNAITQGKMLTAVLETAISSEIPGSVRGIVSRDVYGDSGDEILIPKGSRLFGNYSSKVVRGQGRIDINWTRLIRTDGVDLAITFKASDQFGRAGVAGDIDNRYGNAIFTSFLTSTIAATGAIVAQKIMGNNAQSTVQSNIGQQTLVTTTNAANQAVYDVTSGVTDIAKKIVNDTLNTERVIRVPQGTKITVIVTADMNIPSLRNQK